MPAVPNRTRIHIIQHPREQRHAIGTVRLLRDGLENLSVLVRGPHEDGFSRLSDEIPSGAGLLFPGPSARVLSELAEDERPTDLVVLDGTWGHARTLFRTSPWMAELPRFVIEPSEPSRYRIRKEPKVEFVSTLEAVAYALRALEPELENLDQLIPAFDRMIDKAIASRRETPRARKVSSKGGKPSVTFPPALLVDRRNLVLLHVDVLSGKQDGKRVREPVVWSALRVGTGEARRWHLEPEQLEEEGYLRALMGVEDTDVASRLRPDVFHREWLAWLKPEDALAAWSPWHLEIFDHGDRPTADIKGAYCNLVQRKAGHLAEVPAQHGLKLPVSVLPGRGGRRLAELEAVVDLIRRSAAPASTERSSALVG